jgi:fructose-bisphosphate aldolase class I
MTTSKLEGTARAMVADGKGILAADETARTLDKRLIPLAIESTPQTRRSYREMLFSTPGIEQFLNAVILQDETIRQKSATGEPLIELLAKRGIIPGIKVDAGAKPMAGAPGELVTEGLDGLRGRLEEYRKIGARFAKWRAVFRIEDGRPTTRCMHANADALARYAAICQEQELVPIVEPEVLMDGGHTLEQCESVTGQLLQAVFDELYLENVALEGMLLKPNMVVAGAQSPKQPSVEEVAVATVRTLARHVPPAVPGIVFLSGGQDSVTATAHLDAISRLDAPKPWKLTFSFARALQNEALETWHGKSENVAAAQHAFYHRAACVSAAALGRYGRALESAAQ